MAKVVWGSADGSSDQAVALLWQQLQQLGWLSTSERRFVLHIAPTPGRSIAVETARSLTQWLQRCMPERCIEIIDAGAQAAQWEPLRVIDIAQQPRFCVDAACLRGGAQVPELWLESFTLITIVAIAPDTRLRISAALAAQAGLLDVGEGRDVDVIYEAHRLVPADVAIACGTVICGDPASGHWWAASQDTVSLDAALASAAGEQPAALPHLRHLAKHELTTLVPEHIGDHPARLQGYLAPGWLTQLRRVAIGASYIARMLTDDITRAAHNLNRAPDFIRRRFPRLASVWRLTA